MRLPNPARDKKSWLGKTDRSWQDQDVLSLFGMRCDVKQIIGVAPDLKVKTPRPIHAGLPDIVSFVVLLGSQGGMAEIFK
jgi:hypothetical protein